MVDALFALGQSAVITAVMVIALGWRRPGAGREAVWTSALFLFSMLFLVIWAVGAWVTPFGPRLLDREPFPFLFVGIVIMLLLLATMPRRPAPEHEEPGAGLSASFWVLLAVLLAALVSAYPELRVEAADQLGPRPAAFLHDR